jgi:hypothetical protein
MIAQVVVNKTSIRSRPRRPQSREDIQCNDQKKKMTFLNSILLNGCVPIYTSCIHACDRINVEHVFTGSVYRYLFYEATY